MKTAMKLTATTLFFTVLLFTLVSSTVSPSETQHTAIKGIQNKTDHPTTYHTIQVNGVDIFYREAGRKDAPTLVLLHGYPTSSHMFRNLIRDLSADYHLIAPDYPGFGRSEQPPMAAFDYTFDNFAGIVDGLLEQLEINTYSLYVMDYGAPVGYRIFEEHPERVQSIIVQNGNAYEEGLDEFWDVLRAYWTNDTEETRKPLEPFHQIDGLKWQYLYGVKDSTKVSPDNWHVDLQHLSRPENNEIQLALFYDYRTNVPLYPKWQQLFREYQPPMLIVWGQNDYIFPPVGAHPYKRDLKNLEFHLLDTGHFALEEKGDEIANYMLEFLKKNGIK